MTESPSRRRRWVRRLLWTAAALELLYLLAGNLFLLPSVGPPRLNRKPEKFRIHWSEGWTVVPGVVHLRDLSLEARAGRGGWGLELDRVHGVVLLWDLPRRRFRLAGAKGSGMEFRAQLPPEAGPGPLQVNPGSPSKAETSAAGRSQEAPTSGTQTPSPGPRNEPWRIVLGAVAIRKVREVQVGPYLYRGNGRLHGAMRAQTRGGPLAVPGARLDLEPGELEIGGEHAAQLDLLKLELSLDEVSKADRKGRNFLRFLSGRLEAASGEAQLSSLAFLFRRIPSMDLAGEGSGHLLIRLDHGVLQPGTTLYAEGDSEVDYLDYSVRGGGEIAGAVRGPEGGPAEGAVDLLFESFELRQEGAEAPHVFGHGAAVQLTSTSLDLADLEPEMRAVVDLPDSEVPELAYYNRFLPPEAGAEILDGKGRISARMSLRAPAGTWAGNVTLRSEGLKVKVQDGTIAADLELRAELPGGSIAERRAEISGTRLHLDRARLVSRTETPSADPWWARLELPEGQMTLGRPLALRTSFRATVKDTSPLVALVRKDRQSPPWLRDLLTFEDVAGTGEILFQPHRIEARELAFVAGEHIEVQGNLRLAKEKLDALLFCRYRKLSASLEMVDGERDWDLVGSRKWFEEKEKAWLGVLPEAPKAQGPGC